MKESIKETCRRFRKNQTETEKAFWKVARNRKIEGIKILRQYPIRYKWRDYYRFFVADFYCHEAKLVIEIDGGIHESQKEYDEMREQIIKLLGFRVIRFSNEEVLNNIDAVARKLITVIKLNN